MIENKDTSQNRTFVPPRVGITAQNLSKQYGDYTKLKCSESSTNWRDEKFDVFSSFGLDTDGQVFGNNVSLEGDSSLSFTMNDKSYVRLNVSLKSTVLKNALNGSGILDGFNNFDYSETFEVLLESGDSFSAGTRKIGMGWEYSNLSIIKNGSEQMNQMNGLNHLTEMNNLFTFNTIKITWVKSWKCEERPVEIIDENEDSDFIPQTDETEVVESESENESEPISDNTLWAILGITILLIAGAFIANTKGEE